MCSTHLWAGCVTMVIFVWTATEASPLSIIIPGSVSQASNFQLGRVLF